ncbi:MAG TPA: hypothetical protein VL463_35780 [Kofleriaceae bacterium]|nr:hypothetical protein [Kofleriaceae bacterium]
MRADHRGWWTAALAIVVTTWVTGVACGLGFFDEPGGAVFARIAFLRAQPDVAFAEQVAIWSMIVAAIAIVAHLIAAVALQPARITPLATSAITTLVGIAMVPAWAVYTVGMGRCPEVRLTPWFFVIASSSVVVVVCGGVLWNIALHDRRRAQIERVLGRGRPPAAYLLDR